MSLPIRTVKSNIAWLMRGYCANMRLLTSMRKFYGYRYCYGARGMQGHAGLSRAKRKLFVRRH